MEQGKESHDTEDETTVVTSGKSETKSPCVRITKPSKDLNRYLVDKFNQSTGKSKNAPFEAIDLGIYRPSAKCLAFSTSEDRLLLWVTAFLYHYYEITGNTTDYKVVWEEQDSPSSASKCDKIIIHLLADSSTTEEQLITITVFVTTGRIQVQGNKFEEWSIYEFPVLLNIVNTLNDHPDRQPLNQPLTSSAFEDLSLFGDSFPNFFTNFVQFVGDDDIPSSNKGENKLATLTTATNTQTVSTHDPETLVVSPTRLKSITTMRATVGQLEADFSQFQIVSSGNIEQLKDKIVQHDRMIKLQQQSSDDHSSDFLSQIKSLQDAISQQSQSIKALQDENQSLLKKQAQMAKINQSLHESQGKLSSEIDFLKDQMKALWQHSTGDRQTAAPALQQTETHPPPILTPIDSENNLEDPTPQTTEPLTNPPHVILTNGFLLLQVDDESHASLNAQQKTDLDPNPINAPQRNIADNHANSLQEPLTPAVVNKAFFLGDSNAGKFLDKRRLFPPGQKFSYFQCPKIEHALNTLQEEIARTTEHPQLIVIHTGTNDLTPTTPADEFVSNISVFITQASTWFPKSKIIFSTLLPRADIPLNTVSNINMKLIDSCSTLPNVYIVKHDDIFSKGLDILYDNKHLKKRHIGMFAADLVAAICGRPKQARSSSNQFSRSSPRDPFLRSRYTPPLEQHPLQGTQQRPPPLHSSNIRPFESYPSYSNAVKNGQDRTDRAHRTPQTEQQQQNQPHFQQMQTPPHLTLTEQANPNCSTDPQAGAEIPKELVSFFRLIKTLL